MRRIICLVVTVAIVFCPISLVRADCPLDHLRLGQDNGTLVVDVQVYPDNQCERYRHWNSDYATHPDPYAEQYYQLEESYLGGYMRMEPGTGEIADPQYGFAGTQGDDYDIYLERVYATPGLLLYDGLNPILLSDGDTVCVSDFENHHIHMRYHVMSAPTDLYLVVYRVFDATETYLPSEPFAVNFGRSPEPELAVSPETHLFETPQAGQVNVEVTNQATDTMFWTAKVVPPSDWLTISDGGWGIDNGVIAIDALPNDTGADRVAVVRVTADSDETVNSPADILITQSGFYPGDADRDGDVDLDDFAIFAVNFNQDNKTWEEGDFDRDGNVDLDDFAKLAVYFGQGP